MKKFLILDRDGVINEDKEYVYRVEDMVVLPGAIEGLKKFRDDGWKFIVVTNQAGIARGFYSLSNTNDFHRYMRKALEKSGISIEAFYFCPHHPDITGPCRCRKPGTFLVEEAARKFRFKPEKCIYVGDKDSDIQLGLNCGGTTILIKNKQYYNSVEPHLKAKDLSDAFEKLKKRVDK